MPLTRRPDRDAVSLDMPAHILSIDLATTGDTIEKYRQTPQTADDYTTTEGATASPFPGSPDWRRQPPHRPRSCQTNHCHSDLFPSEPSPTEPSPNEPSPARLSPAEPFPTNLSPTKLSLSDLGCRLSLHEIPQRWS